jgi:hypothetical protein
MDLNRRLRKLEKHKQPRQGQLPIVVSDEVSAAELMAIRAKNPNQKAIRFSQSVDEFI